MSSNSPTNNHSNLFSRFVQSRYSESLISAVKNRSTFLAFLALILLNIILLTNTLYGRRHDSSGSSTPAQTFPKVTPVHHDVSSSPEVHSPVQGSHHLDGLVKPEDITISGLVFFGREDRVRSMNCYMERNLVDHGGWLDEVLWVVNTENEKDLAYLDTIIARSDRYKKLDLGKKVRGPEFRQIWKHLERKKLYVKIDDDIVWMANDTIPLIVRYKLDHPDDFAVSANVINNPPLNFLHYHIGALHPYFPELSGDSKKTPSTKPSDNKSWRFSQHPFWQGPDNFEWPLDAKPPAPGHRWLRVEDDKAITHSPATQLKYEVWGHTYTSWAIGAQQHYSFLENLESNRLDLYKFNKPWNMDNERIRINALAIMGDDVLDSDIDSWDPARSDEEMLVMLLPQKYSRAVNVIGEALAAHFNFQHQTGVEQTDLLDRYHNLALEVACLP